MLWNPSTQLRTGYGATTNGGNLNISGTANIPIAIEAYTNLAKGNGIPLPATNLSWGSLDFSYPDCTNDPNRLYRIMGP